MAKYLIILPDKGVKFLFIQICLTCLLIKTWNLHCTTDNRYGFSRFTCTRVPRWGDCQEGHDSRMLYGSQYTLVSSYNIFKKTKIKMFFTKKMPKHCVAYGCTNHNLKTLQVGFHRFPAAPERRKRWIAVCKRVNKDGTTWEPGKHAVLCGAHFISGKICRWFILCIHCVEIN